VLSAFFLLLVSFLQDAVKIIQLKTKNLLLKILLMIIIFLQKIKLVKKIIQYI